MKRLQTLTVLCAGLGATTSWGMGFKTYLNPVKLPYQMSTSEPPVLRFTPPGEMSVGLIRACGDGDVERFSRSNSDFDFVPHEMKEMNVNIGYWVVADGESPLPSSSNFFSIARKRAPVAEQTVQIINDGTFRPEMLNYRYGTPVFKDGKVENSKGFEASLKPGDQNGMALLATDLINLHQQAKRSFGTQKKYRIYAGAFVCLGDQNEVKKNNQYIPSAVETTHSLSHPDHGLLGTINTALNSLDLDNVEEFKTYYSTISYKGNEAESIYPTAYEASSQRPYKFKISKEEQIDIKSMNSIWKAFSDVAKLSYPVIDPAETNPLAKYKSAMKASPVYSKIQADAKGLEYCQKFNINTNANYTMYKWESFPMNLSCKYLHNSDELAKTIELLFNPTSVPNQESFNILKKQLAGRFYAAAVFEATQKSMEKDDSLIVAKSNCFKKSPMINSIIAAYPFEFRRNDADKTYSIMSEHKNAHPEPLFALIDYKQYFADNKVSIWGQLLGSSLSGSFKPESWSILLPLGDENALTDHEINKSTFRKTSINIMLRIRSIGGHCPMFC